MQEQRKKKAMKGRMKEIKSMFSFIQRGITKDLAQ
jgi:hypothetical protein